MRSTFEVAALEKPVTGTGYGGMRMRYAPTR